MGRVKCDHIKRLITLTSDNIKQLSLKISLDYKKTKIIVRKKTIFNRTYIKSDLKDREI